VARRNQLVDRLEQLGIPRNALARMIHVHESTVHRWIKGTSEPQRHQRTPLANALQITLDQLDRYLIVDNDDPAVIAHTAAPLDIDGIDAIELIRRTEATDLGTATLEAIVRAVEGLGSSYTHMVPADFLASLRTYKNYVMRLLDGRATLAQRRELMRQAGWLSLLVATAAIDVGYDRAAAANFGAAHTMANETGDDELAAWTFETEAWQALSAGRLSQASDLCRAGLDVAPPGTSAYAQLCTQAARAAARAGDRRRTRHMVDVSLAVADRLPTPSQENHFTVDKRRVLLHSTAALVWLGDGDPIGEEYARRSVSVYEGSDYAHHLAVARMNLAMLLADKGEPTEAVHIGQRAVTEAGWRLCVTDLFLADDLHNSLRRYDDTADVRTWTESYAATRQEITARQPELTASTSTPPDIG
jgi:transcriptional regulator with XRE-family HTH domain